MTAFLNILRPGLMTTVQDLGRIGYQSLGIGSSGALDPVALRAANLLVGNDPGEGALEVLYLGPTIEIDVESVRLSFVGASATIEILPDAEAGIGTRIKDQQSVVAKRGEIVKIKSLTGGASLYVGIEGGLAIDPTLGSVSTNIRGGTGGWQARALVEGDRLPLRHPQASNRDERRLEGITFFPPTQIRAIPGPQLDYFDETEIARFFDSEFTVGTSDRVGMRLRGSRPLHHTKGFNIVSDAIAPGSVQVPGDGQPIVLLADRQTTGGYPKIATVISADLPALGRLCTGANLRFEAVTVEQAYALRLEMLSFLEHLPDHTALISRPSAPIAPLLFDFNLISGVVDARCGLDH
jgi:biotin-dependent carboxylase-like uncharacterized protein